MNTIINNTISAALPWLTAALPGPLGKIATAAVSGILGLDSNSSPEEVAIAVNNATPSQILDLRKAESEFKLEAIKAGYANVEALGAQDVAVITAINQTIQTETKSEHWPSYGWRPFIGFSFGFYLNSLWLLPLFGKAPVNLTTDMVLAVGGILGVASYFRGKAQADVNNPILKG